MRTLPVVALLALGTGFSAQVLAQTKSAATVLDSVVATQQAAGQNCPVDLRASRLPAGGVLEASPAGAPIRQALHLSFNPVGPRSVLQADITLHGMSGHHVIPAGETSSAYATEDFSVSPNAGANHLFTSVVYMKKLTGVDYVEVKDITFADGSKWHSSANSTCRVAPNGFQLVAGR